MSDASSTTHDASVTPPPAEHDANLPVVVTADAGVPDDHGGDGHPDAGDDHGDMGSTDASVDDATVPTLPIIVADGTFETAYQVLSANCVSCHGAGKPLDMSTPMTAYATLVGAPASMKACASTDGGVAWARVVPGDLDNSLMIQKLEGHAPCGNPMPIKALLPDALVEVFRAWVTAGAPAPLTDVLPLP